MELTDRFNILIQGAHIVQSKGLLSLNDAVLVKNAIDCVEQKVNLVEAAKILIRTAELGQSNGSYTLKDAHYLYSALHGLFDLLPKDEEPETEKGEE